MQNLRYALRTLAKSPGFALTAILTLAVGIGASTAIFTTVDAVLLHPLPYPNAAQLVLVTKNMPQFELFKSDASALDFTDYRARSRSFSHMAALQTNSVNLTGDAEPVRVFGLRVSASLFPMLGVQPIVGRVFRREEEQPGKDRVAILGDGLWKSRFGADPHITGKQIEIDAQRFTVIGVVEPVLQFIEQAQLYVPLAFTPAELDPNARGHQNTDVVARLKPGVTLDQARAEMKLVAARMTRDDLEWYPPDWNIELDPLADQVAGELRTPLLVLLGAVGMVLLIGCVNVANLLLARATARQKEIGLRIALGAGRARIVRQLLTESLLLALGGGAIGLALGSWGVRVLLHLTPGDLPRLQEMAAVPALDPRVAGFTLLVTAITGALFGLFPALQISLVDLASALKESSGRVGTGLRQNRTRSLLVGAEVAIAAVLLCGALLLIRSFAAMHAVSLGFEPRNLLTMQVSLGGPGYAKSGVVDRLARRVVERAEQIPGVESAAFASALPLQGRQDMLFSIPGRQPLQGYYFTGDVQWRIVSPRYFDTLRIPLLSGRFLRDQEPGRTVVISQAMARKYWPDANPVGQTIVIGPRLGPDYEAGPTEIVGVAGDVRERLNIDPAPVMYQAPSQVLDAAMALVNRLQPAGVLIRTRPGVAPMSVSPAVQQALLALDQLPASDVRTMDQVSRDSTARQNFNLLLLGLFAAMALLLGAVGIYGVMSYSVEQRTHEIGIRAALGAGRRDTLKLVLLGALRTAIAGVAVGIAASFGLTRLLTSQLFGVKPSDPLTFAVVPAVLIAVALSAAGIPALRATRIDPLTALRHE